MYKQFFIHILNTMSEMSLSVMEILLFCDQKVMNLSHDCKTKVKLRKIDVFPRP